MEPFPYLEHISVYRNCSHLGAGLRAGVQLSSGMNAAELQCSGDTAKIHVKQVISELWRVDLRANKQINKTQASRFFRFFFFFFLRQVVSLWAGVKAFTYTYFKKPQNYFFSSLTLRSGGCLVQMTVVIRINDLAIQFQRKAGRHSLDI